MPFNPNHHHRRSIRISAYDYTEAGDYFITLCTQDKECLFGEIKDKQMVLNQAGRLVLDWWLKLEKKFPGIKLGPFIIMPNHLHAIIEIMGSDNAVLKQNIPVGADPCVRPGINSNLSVYSEPVFTNGNKFVMAGSLPVQGGHMGPPLRGVPQFIQWFKTMTTNEYIKKVKQNHWPEFNRRLWQRNYYEHIIANEDDYNNIVEYIQNNPLMWERDRNNGDETL
ncbi:MAG: transposase [Patescibacteria group bacterium]|jgi:REP element-mobilizing transposase RayT